MNFWQILGLIGALLLGIYNTYREWDDRKSEAQSPPAVESVYEVDPSELPPALPPTDPGK